MFSIDEQEKRNEYKKRGWRILGHFCSYTPEELFYRNGILPIRIFPEFTGSFERADKYFPAYTCSFGRSALNGLLSSQFAAYDAFFFSSNCDTIRHLFYHFQRTYPDRFIPQFTIPAKVFSSASRDFIRGELEKLEKEIQKRFPSESAPSLEYVTALYRKNRALIRELVAIRMERPGLLSAATMNAIYRYNMWVDKETANVRLTQFIADLKKSLSPIPRLPRVFVLGNCCGNNEVVELVERCGSAVVNDLLASGNKYFDDVDDESDPLSAIAARLNGKIVCPTKMIADARERDAMYDGILKRIRAADVDGIVVLNQKFCDPHGLDKPHLLPKLDAVGIPLLELESEQDMNNVGQLTNRLEAFFEVIG